MSTVSTLSTAALSSSRWRHIIPVAFVTYTFAYVDRSNYSLGAAGGLTRDLHITAATAGLLGALFFLGYFFFQIPAAHFAEHRSVRTLMFWSLIGWGIFASAQGVIPWVPLLMVDRFLLGVVEAAVIPAMLIFLVHWFTNRERGRADTFLILGNPVTVLWMSALSGYLIAATSWRWMFIIEGAPAIIWAFVFRALVVDLPKDAAWLDKSEKAAVTKALDSEQSGMPLATGYWAAFRQVNVILLAVQYALWSVGVYGFVLWLPSIIKFGSKQGIGNTGLLSAVPYALAIVLMLLVSYFSDRSGRRIAFVVPVPGPWRSRLLRVLPGRRPQLPGLVRAADHRRRCHVRALWPVFRADPGAAATRDGGRRDGPRQQLWRSGGLRRRLPGWLPRRQPPGGRGVCRDGRVPGRRRSADAADPAAADSRSLHCGRVGPAEPRLTRGAAMEGLRVHIAEQANWLEKPVTQAVIAAGAELAPLEWAEAVVWGFGPAVQLADTLARAPNVSWVQLPAAGVEAYTAVIDRERLWTSAKGAYSEPVAEHALALLLAGFRQLPRRARARSWQGKGGQTLFDASVVILGGGGIATTLLELLRPFRANVTVVRKHPQAMAGATAVVPDETLADAVVGVHIVIGLLLVIDLWAAVWLALRAGAPIALAAVALAWSIVMPSFGLVQAGLLPGSAHVVIQVGHLLIGLAAVGLIETLGSWSQRRAVPA